MRKANIAVLLLATLAVASGCASGEKSGTADVVSSPSASGKEMPTITDSLKPVGDGARTLVVYFSQGAATRSVAEDFGILLGADMEPIVEKKTRSTGLFSFMRSGYQATFKIASPIVSPVRDPSSYDRVIVLTPVWSWNLCPPVRSWLRLMKGKLPAAAFVTVSGDTDPDKIVAAMAKESGTEPRAVAGFRDKDFLPENRAVYVGKIAELCLAGFGIAGLR